MSEPDDLLPMSAVAGSDLPGEAPRRKKDRPEPVVSATAPLPPGVPAHDPDEAIRALGTKRGVETLFRTSYRVNMDLTALADTKANIMISINGLMISILISQIASKMESNPWLYFPTAVFVIGCLVSLIFAVLAARPRVQGRAVTLEEVRRNKTNILFFGNFAHLRPDEFSTAMKERMNDPADMYTMMMDDIYGVGAVLQRKYRMINTSYIAFMAALVLGVAAFVGVFWYATTLDRPLVYAPVPVEAGTPVAPVVPAVPLVP